MKEFGRIIAKHRSEFDSEVPLEGDFERFMAKWEEVGNEQIRNGRIWGWRRGVLSVAASVALVIAVGFTLRYFSPQQEILRIYEGYCEEVSALTTEMQMMVCGDEIENINNVINSINYESVPLFSLLPEEMSQREKVKLIKEHYHQKMEGIKRFKVLLTESKIEEEL